MKKITFLVLSIMALGQISPLAQSIEAPKNKITEVSRKVIQSADVDGSNEELRMMLVEFPPEYSNVAHSHPVGGLCYVIIGTAESQYEGEDVKVFHAGDSYQDQANKKHLLFRNTSKTEPLKFMCTAKINKNQQFMQPL